VQAENWKSFASNKEDSDPITKLLCKKNENSLTKIDAPAVYLVSMDFFERTLQTRAMVALNCRNCKGRVYIPICAEHARKPISLL